MEELKLIKKALNLASKQGVFNLTDNAQIYTSLQSLTNKVKNMELEKVAIKEESSK